ncbi:TRAP transporter small permease subunit [Actibacterium mucosum]|nr:TRAP transporter small permease subunit [Actibacterium mucosum]
MTAALRFADFIDAMTRLISHIASVLLLALVALVFCNVAGRYVIGNAPVWMQELEWHLLVPTAMLGIVVLMLEKGHVRVDMLYDKMSPKARHWIDFVSMVLGAAVALLLIRYSTGFVENSFSLLEGSPDPGGLPGRWALKGFLPIAFALLALQCAANAIRSLNAIRSTD